MTYSARIAEIKKRHAHENKHEWEKRYEGLSANDDRAELLAIVEQMQGEIGRLRKGLKPFAACIGNDNGDVTQHDHASHDAYCDAYFLLHRAQQQESADDDDGYDDPDEIVQGLMDRDMG